MKYFIQFIKFAIVFSLLFCTSLLSNAQLSAQYVPGGKALKSESLINSIRSTPYSDLYGVKPETKKWAMKWYYTKLTNSLVESIKNDQILDNDTLQKYVESIFRIIVKSNNLKHTYFRVLIFRDAQPNAYCVGEGTFKITLGLLSKSKNESQLAFAIAHELAHYELKHVFNNIEREVENQTSKSIRKKARTIINDNDATREDVEEFRNLLYGETR